MTSTLNWLPDNYELTPDGLDGRVVLVSGASEGLGRAVAKHLAAHGATVIALARTIPRLESLYDEIVEGGGPEPVLFPIDFRGATPADYDEMAERIRSQLGRLDATVHCAAALTQLAPFEQGDAHGWAEVFQVNLHAPYLLTRASLGLLRESARAHGGASVIYTTCALGQRGRAYWGAYAASKSALERMGEVLADELEDEALVRLFCVDPGPLRTGLRATAYPGEDPNNLPATTTAAPAYAYLCAAQPADLHGRRLALR